MRVLSLGAVPGTPPRLSCSGADLIEWRLDRHPFDPVLARRLPRPWIATLRHRDEGGSWSGTDDERLNLYRRCLEAGARWVDVEAARPARGIPPARLLRSIHLPDDRADTRRRALQKLQDAVGAMGKWVAPVDSSRDLSPEEHRLIGGTRPTVVIHMGSGGAWTRIRPPGHDWSYVAASRSEITGPGQFTLAEHRRLGVGRLFGILGWPVDHSLSPAVHNRLFHDAVADAAYVHVPMRDLDPEFPQLRERFDGFSVTAPHKTGVLDLVDEVDTVAHAVGAANTLTRNGTVWSATNTDALALKALLAGAGVSRGTPVTVAGAGGFARAALWAGQQLGAGLTVTNRSGASGENCASDFEARFIPLEEWDGSETGVLVQATPVPEAVAARAARLNPAVTVIESVYATDHSWPVLRVIDGRTVFCAQAALQSTLWTGRLTTADDVGACL